MLNEPKKTENGNAEAKEPKIFVMPEKFLGILPGIKTAEEAKKTAKIIAPPAVLQAQTFKKKKFPLIPTVIGVLLFVAIVGAGIYFFVLPRFRPTSQIPAPPKIEESMPKPPSITEEKPKEEATSAIPEELIEEPAPVEEGIHSGLDSDGDGLTDAEEEVFGTVVSNPDTDLDGFLDGHEVFHLYNPAGVTPEKLLDTGVVKNYKNETDKYQIYYPSKWTVGGLGSGGKDGTIINSGTGEFVTVVVEENPNNLPIISWYLEQSPGVKAGEIQTFVTKSNFDGIKSPDGFSAYFTRDGVVYIISYNIGTKIEINYKRTFEMMLNSFRIDR